MTWWDNMALIGISGTAMLAFLTWPLWRPAATPDLFSRATALYKLDRAKPGEGVILTEREFAALDYDTLCKYRARAREQCLLWDNT